MTTTTTTTIIIIITIIMIIKEMQLYLNDQIFFLENTSTHWIRLNFSRIEKNRRFKIYRVDRSIKTDDIVDTDNNLGHSFGLKKMNVKLH